MKYFIVLNGYPTSSSKFSSETFYDVDSARNYWSSIIDEYPKSYLECYYVDFEGRLSLEYTEKDLSVYRGDTIIVPQIDWSKFNSTNYDVDFKINQVEPGFNPFE